MAGSSQELLERLQQRSYRYWRAWLERGTASEAEAEAVFGDKVLCGRLAAPLSRFAADAPGGVAVGGGKALTARAAELAKKAAAELEISAAAAEDLVRVCAESRAGALPSLHQAGASAFDLLEDRDITGDLRRLLHSERCETLQVLATVLRRAHDARRGRDGGAVGRHCLRLAQKLLDDGLGDALWRAYREVSSCPSFSAQPDPVEVRTVVRQGLDLQVRVLECLVLAHYDPELCALPPRTLSQMADLFLRQRFLGSLPRTAHGGSRAWLYSDAHICAQAQCIGDLCLTVMLEGFALETFVGADGALIAERHPLLKSPDSVYQLHRLITTQWVDIAHLAAPRHGDPAAVSPEIAHCAHAASIVTLAWASLVAGASTAYREAHGLGFERLAGSSVLRSAHVVADAAHDIVARGFLFKDAPTRQRDAPRAVFRALAASVSAAFQLDAAMPGVHRAVSELLAAAHDGEVAAAARFWTSHYPSRQGGFYVLQGWLSNFPSGLDCLLDLVGSLASSESTASPPSPALHALSLLRAPMEAVSLPYQVLQPVTQRDQTSATVALKSGVYAEELILRSHGLVLSDWHVDESIVLRQGLEGTFLDASPDGLIPVRVRLELRPCEGVRLMRVMLMVWDAFLEGMGWTQHAAEAPHRPPSSLPAAVVRCICRLLLADAPAAFEALAGALPRDERGRLGAGVLARLLATTLLCAESEDPETSSLVPLLLRALGACCQVTAPAPLYATLLALLQGRPHSRCRTRDAGALAALFSAAVDRERQTGVYTTTMVALEFCSQLLEACPAGFLALPWASHSALAGIDRAAAAAPARAAAGIEVEEEALDIGRGVEAVGCLLDFVFCLCFARCKYWSYSSPADQWQISSACIRVARAVLPTLACFNWQLSAELEAGDVREGASAPDVADAIRGLRAVQLRILRSWSEGAFIPALLQCIVCDVVFTAPGADGGAGGGERQFAGFRSAALDDRADTGVVDFGRGAHETLTIGTGAQVVVGALKCLHGVLELVLRPGGFAPRLAPFAAHLLDATSLREARGPAAMAGVAGNAGGDGPAGSAGAPWKANLVQSLYAHLCVEDDEVAEWAATSMAALCALWSHGGIVQLAASIGARAQAAAGRPAARPSILAFLAAPSAGAAGASDAAKTALPPFGGAGAAQPQACVWPELLAPQLGARLMEVIADRRRSSALRAAFVDVARAALTAAPTMFLDDAAAFASKSVVVGAQTLAHLAEGEEGRADACDGDRCRLLVATLGLLDGLFEVRGSVAAASFGQAVDPSGGAKSYGSTWEVLSAIVAKVLLPLADRRLVLGASQKRGAEESTGDVFLAAASTFRLAERGRRAAAETPDLAARGALIGLITSLLHWSKSALWLPQASPDDGGNGAKRARGPDSAEQDTPSVADSLWHPFGRPRHSEEQADEAADMSLGSFAIFEECRSCADRLHMLLSKHRLGLELLAPQVCADVGGYSEALASFEMYGQDRCVIPPSFRRWADLCEVACGTALQGAAPREGRAALRETLRIEKLGAFGSRGGPWRLHSGAACVDAYVVGAPLQRVSSADLRLLAAGLAPGSGGEPQLLGELGALRREAASWSAASSAIAARVVALEAFDDFVMVSARQSSGEKDTDMAKQVQGLVVSLTPPAVFRLAAVLQRLDLLAESAPFFARAVDLATRLLTQPPYYAAAGAAESQVAIPFGCMFGRDALDGENSIKDLLKRETALGVALARQLTAALRVCCAQLRHRAERGVELPPRGAALLVGAEFSSGGLPEVALACVSLLMLLVPALRHRAEPGAAPAPSDASALLVEMLGTLAELLECSSAPAAGAVATRAPTGQDVSARLRALDHFIRSGFEGVVLALAERVISVLSQRETPNRLPDKAIAALRRGLLPRILGASGVLSPTLDPAPVAPLAPYGAAGAAAGRPGAGGVVASGRRRGASSWERAVEAAWACRFDAATAALLAIAQTPEGAVLLAEHRLFLLLAHCPLLRAAVLPGEASAAFPAAYVDPSASAGLVGDVGPGPAGSPWRRPLHASWCRALLLVASALASAPRLASEARIFLAVFAPRISYVLRSGLQLGQLALLEEAAVACRVLALTSRRCSVVETLVAQTAAQACAFVVGSCLTERGSPSEVFAPLAAAERLGAGLQLDSEASPAEVPSIFHQRVEYLALELLRNMLAGLLGVATSPSWLSEEFAGAAMQGRVAAAQAAAPQGAWPNAGSVFGLRPNSGADGGAGGQLRAWAAVMDAALEGARRVAEILETLHGKHVGLLDHLLLVAGPKREAVGGESLFLVPLSLSLATLEPFTGARPEAEGVGASCPLSPSCLAKGLVPPAAQSPQASPRPLSPPSFAKDLRSARRRDDGSARASRFGRMALQPLSTVGGQQALGLVPEFVSFPEMRKMCESILEMACTLLCRFCQATQSSILAGAERSAPGSSVLHGLLSFLHKLLSPAQPGSSAIDTGVIDYLRELDIALRSWQNLGHQPELQSERSRFGEAWAVGDE